MNSPRTAIPHAAQEAADRGELVAAIKITREATGLGLKEAKEAVESYSSLGVGRGSAAGGDQVPLGAISSLHQGDLIGAIRQTREATGRGLKDSKEAVESYLEAHPHVRDQFRSAARRHGGGVGRLVTFIGLVIIAALVVLWLSGRV
jgi:ribosomal protein L7/L12